ncbi:cystathionine gamma-synthase [Clostridia bacterium]|nr:cystathionine gamma-synthase [Clostridia bacterium]
MHIQSKCVHGRQEGDPLTGAICTPIYQSATFSHPGVGESKGYDYSRLQNPTREKLEYIVADLEEGKDAIACSSGMAAVSILMEVFQRGDHLLASEDLYGGTIRLFNSISQKNGIEIEYVDTSDLLLIKEKMKANTKAIFIENPTNPMMHVTDLVGVKDLLAQKDILIIVDNTFLSPYYCRPLTLGADIVLHSGTKYLGGHNDTLAGFIVTKTKEIGEKLRFIYKTVGCCLGAMDSYLLIRGIKTLALRMERMQENAMKIAQFLEKHPKVKKVYYLGLPSHPQYALSQKQSSGFGAMISFTVDSKDTAMSVLEKVQLIIFAESLGGVETLLTHPAKQTHTDVPAAEREKRGISDTLLRLSVGIENSEDLIADLKSALA